MKNFLRFTVFCMFLLFPEVAFSQGLASCSFNYGDYSERTPIPVATDGSAAGLIGGEIYLAGGFRYEGDTSYPSDLLMVYDPETDSWDTTGARLPVPRIYYGGGDMALNGKLYTFGGVDVVTLESGVLQMIPNARLDVYDPQTDTWELKANLPIPIGGPGVCNLNGKLYVSGGLSTDQIPLKSLFSYDPVSDQWTELSSMQTPRLFPLSVALDGKIYAIGGVPSADIINDVTVTCEVYDPDLDQWSPIASLPRPSVLGAACVVNGEIYMFGGAPTGPGIPLAFAYKYNPEKNAWIRIDNMEIAAKFHALIPLDRTMYLIGVSWDLTRFVQTYTLSDIVLDALFPDTVINGDSIVMDLSKYFSHMEGGEITYSACISDTVILEATIDGNMLAINGLAAGTAGVRILAESGEDQMGDLFVVNVASPTGIDRATSAPTSLRIYPNPSTGTATLDYTVHTPGMIRIEVSNMLGQSVAVPLNEYRAAGEYELQLNVDELMRGIYFCRLHTSGGSTTVKLMVEH